MAAAAAAAAAAAPPEHLVVLQHGIAGTPEELKHIGDALLEAFPGRLRVVLSEANTGKTFDGVVAGGSRLAALVREQAPGPGGHLSFISHSLGGIYARSALRCLESEGWFDISGVSAVNFVTTATPHLGIAEVEAYWRWGIWLLDGAFLLDTLLGVSVRDLALRSSVLGGELVDEVALTALRRFNRRAAYGNVAGDLWVRPCSALVLPGPEPLAGAGEETAAPGRPWVLQDADIVAAADLSVFPAEHRKVVSTMLSGLCSMPWERYAVHFPASNGGDAHGKICHHAVLDTEHEGVHVEAHIAQTFMN